MWHLFQISLIINQRLTSKDNQKAGPADESVDAGGSEGTSNTNKEEGGGEAGERRGL